MLILNLVLALSASAPRHYAPEPVSVADAPTPADAEVLRIQRHLQHVEQTLRTETPASMTAAQRAARAEVLDVLHAYWTAGEFPKNKAFGDRRVPHFIDDEGTACAVGHLMLETGAEQMAREIATYENYDFLADIDHPSVGGWLDAHGLTAEEAGWIQPSYGPCGPTGKQYVCGSDGNTYACENIAVNCAGVEVVSEGVCGAGGSESTDGAGTTSTGGVDTALDTDGSTGDATGVTSGETTGEGTTTGDPSPDVIGPEICPSGESDTLTPEGSTGDVVTTGDSADDATEGDEPEPGESTSPGGSETGDAESGGADEDDKGCSVQSRPAAPVGMAALLMLGLVARRRRSSADLVS